MPLSTTATSSRHTGGEQRTGFASHILRDYWRRKTS